ncbi:polysaccharide deacetylase family protein [Microcoleus sp. FACHB-831]|uniref:polysaccharide deacetylase family protein n=1 Tax=Microcoleus sp. FACHB-831 TaxID=2692827 RepID=UPI00168664BF|nr:polysaccharide deacetylase family protein [Microcoleus sp. FACHB-831]MBD1922780.1 polysaccharide deacetylase family protein [Microcoleus sp. FACHB-831]
MGSYRSFFWQRRIPIALVAAACSFLIALMQPWNRLGEQATSQSPAEQIQIQNATGAPLEAKNPSALKNEALNKALSRLEKETRLSFYVPARFQAKTVKEAKLNKGEKVIALTFDDGPWPKWTEQILDILKKNNIKATFFWVGQVLQEYPHIAKKVVDDGHAIANHTWHHWYRRMDEATAASEIDRTADLIYKTTGARTSIFRPPGGMMNNGLVAYAQKKNYVIAMWSSDSIDYRPFSPDRLVHNMLKNAKPGGILLMHDGGGDRSRTVKALPRLISELRKQGYKFVTLTELLEMQDKEEKLVTAAKPAIATPATQEASPRGDGDSNSQAGN